MSVGNHPCLSSAHMALAIQRLRQERPESEMLLAEPIAVIGIGCRFPGGVQSPEDYWRLLYAGRDAIAEVPAERWSAEQLYDPDPQRAGRMNTRWGGFLPSPELFDPVLFGIAPREASSMDPQQRLLLEVVWEALWDSGMAPDRLAGSRTGVFTAICNSDYSRFLSEDRDAIGAHTCTGKSHSIASGRISYLLDLRGPSVSVDTACSSSLVAIHLACESLRTGVSRMAIAGGVSLHLGPEHLMSVAKLGMLSPNGRCKTFDARADGFVAGEGCGIVVVKRLTEALADGNRVLAVIRGTAVNQDGRTNVLTAPNGLAQQEVVRAALANARISPADITYVETHGTGTSLGDPIEIEALAQVLDQPGVQAEPCFLGAVKTNIGHLEAAAGVAGLIKVVLALRKGEIPPNLHFERLNPHIALEGSRFRLPLEAQPWTRRGKPRFAGVSSFGFSGTNAHVVLEEAPRLPEPPARPSEPVPMLLAISARNAEALHEFAARYRDFLDDHGPAAAIPAYDLCHNAALRRSHYEERLAIIGDSREALRSRLQDFLDGRRGAAIASGRAAYVGDSIVFACSGQGSQWAGMGTQLIASEPAFRAAIEECDRLIRQRAGWSLIDHLAAPEPETQLSRTAIAQPAIFAVEVALARLWQSWGIAPAAIIGHSVGEVAAAHIAGVLDLDEAVRLVIERGRIMDRATGMGMMAAVQLPAEKVAAELARLDGAVSIAAVNSPASTVISGERASIEALVAAWRGRGTHCRSLEVDYAFHSRQMEPLSCDFAASLGEVKTHAAAIPIFSTTLGRLAEGHEFDTAYWAANIRRPVQFAGTAAQALAKGFSTFLEIGPHPVLAPALAEILSAAGAAGHVTTSLRCGGEQRAALLQSLGTLYVQGQPIDWKTVYPQKAPVSDLPAYPYQRQRYWIEKTTPKSYVSAGRANPFAGKRLRSPSLTGAVYEAEISLDRVPYLADHKIGRAILMPATAWMEMILQAAADTAGSGARAIQELVISEPLVLSTQDTRTVQVVFDEENFRAFSLQENDWKLHAQGRVRVDNADTAEAKLPHPPGRPVLPQEFYRKWSGHGLEFGPAFRRIAELWADQGEALAHLHLDATLSCEHYLFHPALLDGCLQIVLAAAQEGGERCWLPFGIEQLRVLRPAGSSVWAHARLRKPADSETLAADIDVRDEAGEPVAEIRGLQLRAPRRATAHRHIHRIRWSPAPLPAGKNEGQRRRWVIAGDAPQTAAKLADALRARGAGALVLSAGPLPESEARADIILLAGVEAEVRNNGCAALLDILQSIAHRPVPAPTRIVVVTQGAVPVVESDRCEGVAHAPEWGLARSLALEHPEIECASIDLDSGPLDVDMLAENILRGDGASEVAFRGGERYTPSLESVRAEEAVPRRLEIPARGCIDNIAIARMAETPAPGLGEIEVAVETSALNFRDVLNVLGLYPGDPGPLGLEFCGRVTRLGEGVSQLQTGDFVAGIAWGSFADYITTPAAFVFKVPAGLDAESAVTLPNAFLTAWHCLVHVARIAPGNRVLIHAATGGVGLAAVQIAQRAGAEIFATAGSEEKRQYLHSLGIAHVMDSRSSNFAADILGRTAGAGVDIVLNSLAGDMIPAGLATLARGGHFIEIGKTDIWTNQQVAALGRHLRYTVVDLANQLNQEPELIRSHLAEIRHAVENASLRPLPKRVFAFEDAAAAFRHMAQARHMGKIVLRHRQSGMRISADASYLITGGLGGLGLQMAHWLVARGARNLVLVGRSAPSEQALAPLQQLRQAGARVEVRQVDVSQRNQVETLLRDVKSSLPPLAGIIHSAGVLDDGPLVQQTMERFERVLAPKVAGAWNLHQLTSHEELDFFVLFSSVASVFGSPGQGSYAAANRFLDTLAHYRRARGLPGLSVNWGAWAETGMAARVEAKGIRRVLQSIRTMTPQACLASFELAAGLGLPQVIIADADLIGLQRASPAAPVEDDIAERLKRAPAANQRAVLVGYLREQVQRIVGLSASQHVDERQPLLSLGLDSLMAVEFRNRLAAALKTPLPATLLFDYPTLAALAGFLLPAEAAKADSSGDRLLKSVEALTEEEAERALALELETTL